jgi:aryl-alcohol dehydrogenase-like predicted oxidoreductase
MSVDPLERRRLGTTDVTVPVLGLGTAPLGGWPTAVPRAQGVATIRRAWDAGVRYFDTAPFYGHGNSESFVGAALGDEPRDAFALSTKVGRLLVPGEPEPGLFAGTPPLTPVLDYSYDGKLRSLRESRERLGLERIDIAFVHDPDDHHDDALQGAHRALAELRERGELGAIGVGMNWSAPLARFASEADFDCFLLAGRYTLLEQGALDELLPEAVARDISIVAGGVYNSGVLIDPRPGASYDYAPADAAVLERAQALQAVCAEFSVPLRAAALQFPLAHPAVASVVVGARTPSEVDDTLAMLTLDIPDELWGALRERGLLRDDAPTP